MNTAENAYYLRRLATALADMGTDVSVIADILSDSYDARKGD